MFLVLEACIEIGDRLLHYAHLCIIQAQTTPNSPNGIITAPVFFAVMPDGKMSLVHQWVSQRLSRKKLEGQGIGSLWAFSALTRRTQCRYILESLGAIPW